MAAEAAIFLVGHQNGWDEKHNNIFILKYNNINKKA